MKQIFMKRMYGLLLLTMCVFSMTGCRKPSDEDFDIGIILTPYFHIEYEVHNGYEDSGIYTRLDDQVYVKHVRGTGGSAEFFAFEENDIGFNDGQGVIQDYITYRLIGTQWVRATNWNDNINYYTIMNSGSWSPYQSGTVYGPFYYLTQGVQALNNDVDEYVNQADETLSIQGGLFPCLVYTFQETYTTTSGQLSATTKIWLDKSSMLLFKKSYTTSSSVDINSEEAIEFEVTKYFTGTAIAFPNGVPVASNQGV